MSPPERGLASVEGTTGGFFRKLLLGGRFWLRRELRSAQSNSPEQRD